MKNKKFQYVISKAIKGLLNVKCSLRSGSLLIEIMVALMVFAGLAIMTARYHVSIIRTNKDASDYLHAVNLASDALEVDEKIKEKVGQFDVAREIKNFNVSEQFKANGLTTERLKKMKIVLVKVTWRTPQGLGKKIELQSINNDTQGF